MNLDDFVLSGWPLVAWLVGLLAVGLIAGAALGFFNASTDLAKERKQARDGGFQSGIETAWHLIGSDARRLAAVTLGDRRADLRGQGLYDQDESPFLRALRDQLLPADPDRVYVAPRVVTDDGEELSPGSGQPGAGTLVLPRALLADGTMHFVKFERGED